MNNFFQRMAKATAAEEADSKRKIIYHRMVRDSKVGNLH